MCTRPYRLYVIKLSLCVCVSLLRFMKLSYFHLLSTQKSPDNNVLSHIYASVAITYFFSLYFIYITTHILSYIQLNMYIYSV